MIAALLFFSQCGGQILNDCFYPFEDEVNLLILDYLGQKRVSIILTYEIPPDDDVHCGSEETKISIRNDTVVVNFQNDSIRYFLKIDNKLQEINGSGKVIDGKFNIVEKDSGSYKISRLVYGDTVLFYERVNLDSIFYSTETYIYYPESTGFTRTVFYGDSLEKTSFFLYFEGKWHLTYESTDSTVLNTRKETIEFHKLVIYSHLENKIIVSSNKVMTRRDYDWWRRLIMIEKIGYDVTSVAS